MILFAIVFISSFLLTFLVKTVAKKKLMDVPNERSSHIQPTPRGGGLAIVITWFAGLSYLFLNGQVAPNLYYALMAGLLISAISFIDDIYDLKSLPRLLIQSVATLIALYFIGGLTQVDLGIYVIDNKILLTSIAFIGVIWFINVFNFIDGIDGYAASEAIFISAVLFFFLKDSILMLLCISVLGFLPWNWDKAKIFMGDVGSTLLGFTLCVLAIYYNNSGQFSILPNLMLSSLFWFDATYTLYKRFRNKERLGEAHRKHIYQRIVQSGFSHKKTVLSAILINLLLFLLVWKVQEFKHYILLFLSINFIILFILSKIVNNKKPFK